MWPLGRRTLLQSKEKDDLLSLVYQALDSNDTNHMKESKNRVVKDSKLD